MRFAIILSVSLALGVAVLSVFEWNRWQPQAPIESEHIVTGIMQAKMLLNTSQPEDALAILTRSGSPSDFNSDKGKEWVALLVDAYAATEKNDELEALYRKSPQAFSHNQQASLMVAASLLDQNDFEAYKKIRGQWQDLPLESPRWFFYDSEMLLSNGLRQEAIAFLASKRFQGKSEADRLIRLAALHIVEDPERAWNYLSEASNQDPNSSDLHLFKASLLDSFKESNEALIEHITAIQKDSNNPYRREQLAEFYLRHANYSQALEVLQDGMLPPSLDTIWLKAVFWGRVIRPLDQAWNEKDLPSGDSKTFIQYVAALPVGVFWDEQSFKKLDGGVQFLENFQEAFWLQLIAALKIGDEVSALKIIRENPFRGVSWAPELEKSLKTILIYRQQVSAGNYYSANVPTGLMFIKEPQEAARQFLVTLSSLSEVDPQQLAAAVPPTYREALLSKEAFALPFLAQGWKEAALQLHKLNSIPPVFPSWVSHELTKAIEENRNPEVALHFALSQESSSPALLLAAAEIALSLNQDQRAVDALQQIYKRDDEIGMQAALHLVHLFLERDQIQVVKGIISAQPLLGQEKEVKEILARIALQEGDIGKAYILYSGLEKQSAEAKSFLAQKAFLDKDWDRAKDLTEALIEIYPDNKTLRANLQKILVEERKK